MLEKFHVSSGDSAKSQSQRPEDPSRRRFLRAFAGVSLSGISACTNLHATEEGKWQKGSSRERYELPEAFVEHAIQEIKERYGITVAFAEDMAIVQRYTTDYIGSILRKGNRNWHEILKNDKRFDRSYVDALWQSVQNMRLQTIEEEKAYIQKKWREIAEAQQEEITMEEREICLKHLLKELAIYPERFARLIAHDELHIIFSENEKTRTIGLSSGVADDARIDIDVQLQRSYNDGVEIFDASVLHHEIMHRIDMILSDATDASGDISESTEVGDWRSLHSEGGGSRYEDEWSAQISSSSGNSMQEVVGTKGLYIPEQYSHGMLYAQKSPHEDRARIMEGLMTEYNHLMKQVENDALLAEKVSFVKATLEHLSGGIMDDEYWHIMAEGNRAALRAYVRGREVRAAQEE